MKHNAIIQSILYLIQGALVGIGAILPGVSGGVLCVAFGVYEPMMELLTHPRRSIKKHRTVFISFALGWLVGFVLLAKAMELLFSASAPIALMLFFGLICGTLPELFRASAQKAAGKSWTPFILTLALAYLFFHLLEHSSGMTVAPSFGGFLFCGFLWGLSMIIPGFSSSSILICLGLYEPMAAGIGNLTPSVILPMFLGIGVTVLLFARLVNMLFHRYDTATSRVVLGFVIASSLKIVPYSYGTPAVFLLSLLCFALGFGAARGMDLLKQRQENRP